MSSPIAPSSYACTTPTDILKCVLHMLRERCDQPWDPKERFLFCGTTLECCPTHWKSNSQKIHKFWVILWYTVQLKLFVAFGVSKKIKSFACLCWIQVKNPLQKDLNLFYLPNSLSPYQVTLLEPHKYVFV